MLCTPYYSVERVTFVIFSRWGFDEAEYNVNTDMRNMLQSSKAKTFASRM